MKREKTETALREEIESQDVKLSHVETKEKNILPDKKSKSFITFPYLNLFTEYLILMCVFLICYFLACLSVITVISH